MSQSVAPGITGWRTSFVSLLLVFLTFLGSHSSAQCGGKEIVVINGSQVLSFNSDEFTIDEDQVINENRVYFLVDEFPIFEYPNSIKSYVESLVEYPEAAIQNNIEGVVLVNFIVEKDGTVTSPRIIRSLGFGCDEEVLGVFTDFPPATPGKIAGTPVRVSMTLPIRFKLKYQ
ncbi:MAG: energy transducer TonB [Bacteroidota bacterium]